MGTTVRLAIFALLAASLPSTSSAKGVELLNFGLKLSHTFGPKGGITPGFELSYVWMRGDGNSVPISSGVTFDFDICSWDGGTRAKVHVGIEGTLPMTLGLDAGPTLLFGTQGVDIALTGIIFAGIYLYPFYSLTFPLRLDLIEEFGLFAKIPLWQSGSLFPY